MRTEEEIRKELNIIKNEIEIYKNSYDKQLSFSTAVCINDNKIWIEALKWVLEEGE